MQKLSLVVPVYFEEDCIDQYLAETLPVLSALDNLDWEIVFVDDGSKDKTVEIIKGYAKSETRIKLVEFSYNHGKQAAVTAGIRHASGDFLLYMDPDLQDPPDEIPLFVNKIREGYDLVFGIRKEKIDSWLNRQYSKIFWSTLNRFTGLEIPQGLAVMRIFNRKFA
ncbi:MAG TPA: glycosyltransferase family 2 protein, partial [Catalimonadaceae bacterium]|nr:glycosyltransferase family 2 protein [Catalimonadaceae bacterium]